MSNETAAHVQQISTFWQKAVGDQIDRWDTMMNEFVKLETKGAEQAYANFEEVSRLAKESVAYSNMLTSQWRKLATDSTRAALDLLAPPKAS